MASSTTAAAVTVAVTVTPAVTLSSSCPHVHFHPSSVTIDE
jgi:hypothetical protein